MKAILLIFLYSIFSLAARAASESAFPPPACRECAELEGLKAQFAKIKAAKPDDGKAQFAIVAKMAKAFVRLTSLDGELDADQTKFVISVLKLVTDEGFRGELLERNGNLFSDNHAAFKKLLASGNPDDRQILRDIDSTLIAQKYGQSPPKPVLEDLGPPPGQKPAPASVQPPRASK